MTKINVKIFRTGIFGVIIIVAIILQQGCKRPMAPQDGPGVKYAPGALVIKFSQDAVAQPSFHLRSVNGTVVTGLKEIDSLNSQFQARSFKPYFFELYNPEEDKAQGKDRLYIFQFSWDSDVEALADIYVKNPFVEEAHPNGVGTLF